MWRLSVSHTPPPPVSLSVCVSILVMTYGCDFHHAFTFELGSGFLYIQERSCITFTAGQIFQGRVHEKERDDGPKTSAPPEASEKTTAHFRLGQKVRRGKREVILYYSVSCSETLQLKTNAESQGSDESSLSPECVRSSMTKNQSTQAASLLLNWPELLPCRHSLTGIWRHFTEAHLQISYFSIQYIPLLNIKTYGSHYLHIGCKG